MSFPSRPQLITIVCVAGLATVALFLFWPESPPAELATSLTPPAVVSQKDNAMLPQAIANQVIADLAQRTGEPVSAFTIESSEEQTWPDSCLGIAPQGQMCAQVMTPGWRVTVRSGSNSWVYRTNGNGHTIVLEP